MCKRGGGESSEYVERRLGRKSDFAHSKSVHETQTTEGESEQAVSLMTPQEITELSENEILVVHRNLKPFRAKRMNWLNYPSLKRLGAIPPPEAKPLPPPPAIEPITGKPAIKTEFVDIDEMSSRHSSRYLGKEEMQDQQEEEQTEE